MPKKCACCDNLATAYCMARGELTCDSCFLGSPGDIQELSFSSLVYQLEQEKQKIAAVPDMIDALNKIVLESKHNIRTWTELDYQDALSTVGKIATAALRKAGQID